MQDYRQVAPMYVEQSAHHCWQPDRQTLKLMRDANRRALALEAQAVIDATFVRGATHIANELADGLDHLRNRQARAVAADPSAAYEYAAIRQTLLFVGLDTIQRYGRHGRCP